MYITKVKNNKIVFFIKIMTKKLLIKSRINFIKYAHVFVQFQFTLSIIMLFFSGRFTYLYIKIYIINKIN